MIVAQKGMRRPRQRRSYETLEKILSATERLLRTRLFEEVSVAQIVAEAGTSVGAFYARFEGKEALLPLLYDRYDRRLPGRLARLLEQNRRGRKTLSRRVREVVRVMVTLFRSQRGLMRALALHARNNPGSIPAEVRRKRSVLHQEIAGLLLETGEEIDHPDPQRAVEMGLFVVAATIRDKILFGDAPHASAVRASDEELRRELSRVLLAYLQSPRTS